MSLHFNLTFTMLRAKFLVESTSKLVELGGRSYLEQLRQQPLDVSYCVGRSCRVERDPLPLYLNTACLPFNI